jgi:hypothetical protein
MCDQCLTNSLYFGEVLPGYQLIRARRKSDMMNVGDWGLVICNDPDYVWSSVPVMDPTSGMTDDQMKQYFAEDSSRSVFFTPDEFIDALYGSPNQGYSLVKAAMSIGYNFEEHGQFDYWLFDHIARYLLTHDGEPDEDPFPNLDAINEHDYSITKY